MGQAAKARLALAQRLAGAHALGDVARDAAVAAERAVLIEHRHAGDADVARLVAGVDAPQHHVVERLARLENGFVLLPGLADDLGRRQLPAPLADMGRRSDPAASFRCAPGGQEAHLYT